MKSKTSSQRCTLTKEIYEGDIVMIDAKAPEGSDEKAIVITPDTKNRRILEEAAAAAEAAKVDDEPVALPAG